MAQARRGEIGAGGWVIQAQVTATIGVCAPEQNNSTRAPVFSHQSFMRRA